MRVETSMIKNTLSYLNPFARLGKRKYSIIFPFIITTLTAIVLEYYFSHILHTPSHVRTPAVLIFLGLIIYFSFRDGMRGGTTATIITISYYFYIIISQYTTQEAFIRDFETTLAFAALYLAMTTIIGGLKQKTDIFIETEANEKNKLQTIIEQMPVGVIITDMTGKVTHANKQLETILDIKIPIGSIFGQDKTKNKASQSPLLYVLNTKKPLKRREFVFEKKDGKKTYIQISASPIYNNSGETFAAAATITDITHQKELEKRKDDFVNIASHELKTPITSMKLFINSLSSRMKKIKDAQTQKIIKHIDYQTNRLQELVNDLLDVSRLQTGKMIFSKEPFLLNDLLKETIENLRAIAKEQNIIFLEKNSLQVSADKFRLQQVVTNLITNAIKYSDPYSDIIVQIQKDSNKAVVSIKDAGIGISREEQKKIFNRLYQVSDKKGKTFPGLGIGLYISKQIVNKHKGSIWVESEKGKGSTFFFSLPLLQRQ